MPTLPLNTVAICVAISPVATGLPLRAGNAGGNDTGDLVQPAAVDAASAK